MIRRCLTGLQAALWAVLITGCLLHATVRDGIDSIVVVFFALPMMVLLGVVLLLTLLKRGRVFAITSFGRSIERGGRL